MLDDKLHSGRLAGAFHRNSNIHFHQYQERLISIVLYVLDRDKVDYRLASTPSIISVIPKPLPQADRLQHSYSNWTRDKSDLLAASKHLERWRYRNERFRNSLEQFTSTSLICDESTSICVARWAYGHAYSTSAQTWLERGVTVPLDSSYAEILA